MGMNVGFRSKQKYKWKHTRNMLLRKYKLAGLAKAVCGSERWFSVKAPRTHDLRPPLLCIGRAGADNKDRDDEENNNDDNELVEDCDAVTVICERRKSGKIVLQRKLHRSCLVAVRIISPVR